MRLIMLVLIVVNVSLFIWSWINHNHIIKVGGVNASVVAQTARQMPGQRIMLVGGIDVENPIKINENSTKEISVQNDIDNNKFGGADCLLFGPILDTSKDSLRSLLQEFESKGIAAHIKANELSFVNEYWVYLLPESSRDLAMTKFHELQAKNIDSFIIADGDLSNGISLGVFDKKDNAERRRNEISKLGYEPLVIEKANKNQEIWLLADKKIEAEMDVKILDRLEAVGVKLKIRKESCDVVASWRDIN